MHNFPGRFLMLVRRAARLLGGLIAAGLTLGIAVPAQAQEKKIKIGVIYDLAGALAGGGSELQYIGAKIMLDQYAKTGVEGYKVEAIYADAQSKPDVAINESVRLLEQEKVDMVLGFFSSAQCVPVAARVEQLKKFMWMTTYISSGVFDNKNYKYVFRPQASADQFGMMTMDFIAQNSQSKFGKEPKDLRVAIIHEDGAYASRNGVRLTAACRSPASRRSIRRLTIHRTRSCGRPLHRPFAQGSFGSFLNTFAQHSDASTRQPI